MRHGTAIAPQERRQSKRAGHTGASVKVAWEMGRQKKDAKGDKEIVKEAANSSLHILTRHGSKRERNGLDSQRPLGKKHISE